MSNLHPGFASFVSGLLGHLSLPYRYDPRYRHILLPYNLNAVFFSSDGLESNDVLYGSDPDFIRGANEIATKILSEILNSLEELGSVSKTKQALAALKLFEVVVKYGDLDGNPALASLARKLWKLSAGSDVAESKNWRENFLSNFIASDKCVNLNVLLTKLKE